MRGAAWGIFFFCSIGSKSFCKIEMGGKAGFVLSPFGIRCEALSADRDEGRSFRHFFFCGISSKSFCKIEMGSKTVSFSALAA